MSVPTRRKAPRVEDDRRVVGLPPEGAILPHCRTPGNVYFVGTIVNYIDYLKSRGIMMGDRAKRHCQV
jgi:hypothetical protein